MTTSYTCRSLHLNTLLWGPRGGHCLSESFQLVALGSSPHPETPELAGMFRTCYRGNLGDMDPLHIKSRRKYSVQSVARLTFLPALNHSFSRSAQRVLHLKNEVVPPSKLWLFNSNEDQQKSPSSFVNASWYPVKSGHYFYNA